MPPQPRVTLAQVAEHARVSISTASRAVRGRGEMAPVTRARILSSAGLLGYSASGEPRGRPRRGTSLLLDLVLGHFHDPYMEEVTAGARTAAARLGYDLVLTMERDHPDDDWPARIASRGSAGVIVGLITPTSQQLATVQEAGIPLVLFEPPANTALALPSVSTTDRVGGATAAQHLVERGARRFIVIGGAPSYRYGRARVAGFVEAIATLDPDAPLEHISADWGARDAQRASATALVELQGDGPIGLFACSDEMAAGAYRAIAAAGLSIPNDVLVVGFDDVRGARWLQPPLTTIRQPIREMAATAVQLLSQAIAGAPPLRQTVELPTELVERGSTRTGVDVPGE